MLLGGDTEEDWLVVLLRLVLVVGQVLDRRQLLLVLDVLLHMRDEGLCCTLDLRRVQLVGRTICGRCGKRGLNRLLRLLGEGL